MKKIIKSVIFLYIITLTFSVHAAIDVLCQLEDSKVISGGLIQTDYQFLTKDGWINANVIEADLETGVTFRPLWSDNGVQALVTTKTLVSQNNALAGVNADFFSWASDVGSGLGSPIGGAVVDGRLATSGSRTDKMAALFHNSNNTIGFGHLITKISIKHVQTGVVEEIGGMNKYSDLTEPMIYTPDWGVEVKSVYDGMCKVVVDDGVVVDVTGAKGAVAIPKNGFVLALIPDKFPFIELVNIGDKLEIVTEMIPNVSTLKSAVGAGSFLIMNGKETAITHGPTGRNPRSGAGTDITGSKLFLVTVDGRQADTIGASLPEFAGIMERVGVYTGVNFDGGGSTSMAARDLSGNYNYVNSPTEKRAVSNVAAVVTGGPAGKLDRLIIELDKHKLYLGETAAAEVYGLDSYGNTISLNKSQVSITGLSPETTGKHTVEAKYQSLTAEEEIMVFEPRTGEDEKNAEMEDAEVKFSIFGSLPEPKTMADNLLRNRLITAINSAENPIVTAKSLPAEITNASALTADYHHITTTSNCAIISLDNSQGGLRNTNSAQWPWLTGILDSISQDNVFLVLSEGRFADQREWDAFCDLLSEKLVAEGKNVYIFSSDAKAECYRREGFRYITVAKSPTGADKDTVLERAAQLQYAEISVKGDEVTWQIKNL